MDFINHIIIELMGVGQKRDKYKKMPLKAKVLFLKRVLQDGESIKKVIDPFI